MKTFKLLCLLFIPFLSFGQQTPADLRAQANQFIIDGECTDALICFVAALSINQNDWKTYEEYGWFLAYKPCMPDYEMALKQFVKALDLNPRANVLWWIGDCYRELNDYAAAIVWYEKYLKNTEGAKDLQDRLKRGQVLPALGLCHFYNGDTAAACEIWSLRHSDIIWLDDLAKHLYASCE